MFSDLYVFMTKISSIKIVCNWLLEERTIEHLLLNYCYCLIGVACRVTSGLSRYSRELLVIFAAPFS